MKHYYYVFKLLAVCLLIGLPLAAFSQSPFLIPEEKKGIPTICYSLEEDMHTKIMPDAKILQKIARAAQNRSANITQCDIEVTYTGFTPEAQAAFQHAVDIWEAIIQSPVTIHLDAYWNQLDPGVLGSAGAGTYYRNFLGAPRVNTWYPIALAEKLAAKDLNDVNNPDIVANFSSSIDWYFGTDGNTPSGKMDLVSVVLHEIGHGLGFSGSMRVTEGDGSYGYGGFPTVYDHFVANLNDDLLINNSDFPNPSVALAGQLTSSNLFFNGPLAVHRLSERAKLYAPSQYNGGSSISHLDESKYSAGNEHSLMSPQIGQAEAIHDPGVALDILRDMGWLHTYILHQPLIDQEDVSSPIVVKAEVFSDTTFDASSLKVFYSTDGFATSQSLTLQPTAEIDNYEAVIPAQASGTYLQYYLTVDESTGRTMTVPGDAPVYYYNIYIGPDEEEPVIAHEPVDFLKYSDNSVTLKATVTDNVGVGEGDVTVELLVNDVMQDPLVMDKNGNLYTLTLTIDANLFVQEGDLVKYKIIATDTSSNNNVAYSPETDYHQFYVDDIKEPVESYANDFNTPSQDFIGSTQFSVAQPEGFNNPAIHTKHPYTNGQDENYESRYTYQLKYPIIVSETNPYMTFREIVLVEPGEKGSTYNGEGFYDYVVVEASRDFGETWVSLLKGYDSTSDDVWLDAFNSDIGTDPNDEQSVTSFANGSPEMYKGKVIKLDQIYAPGETILIRFKLYADQLANGWGWAIDDLRIQGDDWVLNADDKLHASLNIYPNPTNGTVKIDLDMNSTERNVSIEVMDRLGRTKLQKSSVNSGRETIELNMDGMPAGLYFIRVKTGEKESVHKVILTN